MDLKYFGDRSNPVRVIDSVVSCKFPVTRCYNFQHAMLHNSNRIDPIAKKNQIHEKLMYLPMGFQGICLIQNSLREISFWSWVQRSAVSRPRGGADVSNLGFDNPRSRIWIWEIRDLGFHHVKSEISDFKIRDLGFQIRDLGFHNRRSKSLDSKQNMCSKVWKSYSPIEHFHDRYQHLWCIIGSLFMN